jgi:transcriptional regulator with XRE-family HTH domain
MTPATIGRSIRALRQRRGWRQLDLARRVDLHQSAISGVEAGDLAVVSTRTLQRIAEALGAELVLAIRWQGGDLDRLADRAHANLVERIARRLANLGWETHLEVSFSRFGERGSIDILAWHPATHIALIIEVKSEIAAVEETLRRHDVKVRLAPAIVFDRLGVRPAAVGRLLVAPDTSTTRRRIEDHAETFGRAYPARGRAVTRWLADPRGSMAGLLLVPPGAVRARRRVRVSNAGAAERGVSTAAAERGVSTAAAEPGEGAMP